MQPQQTNIQNCYLCTNNMRMKRILALTLAALCALLLATSCDMFSIPGRMEALAATVEKNGSSYSQDQWDKANQKFEKIYQEYKQKKGSLTQDEIKRFRSATGRYATAAVKAGVDSVSATIQEIGEELPGLLDEIGGFFKNLGE